MRPLVTVVSYDISDDGKRGKVARILEDYGRRVQYSVFECQLDERLLKELLGKLEPYGKGGDSIRVYRLCQACRKKFILLGEGVVVEQPRSIVI